MNLVLKFLRHQFQSLYSCKSQRHQTFSSLCKECSSKNKQTPLAHLPKKYQNKIIRLFSDISWGLQKFQWPISPTLEKLHLRIDDAANKQARETTSQRKYRVKFKYNALKHFTFVIWEMLIFNIKWKRKFNIAELCDGAKALMNSVE